MSRLLAILLFCAASASAQVVVWTNGAGDSLWTTADNWSAGVPGPASQVQIGSQPTESLIGIDTGIGAVQVASFTFKNTLTGPVSVLTVSDQLTVGGTIVNDSGFAQLIDMVVNAGGDATYAGGEGLTFNTLNVGTAAIATTGSVKIQNTLVFDIASPASYGRIGAVSVFSTQTRARIQLNFVLDPTQLTGGTIFDFTTGSFSGATLAGLPDLAPGLSWDTSGFFSSGLLVVVPEPATWTLLAVGLILALWMGFKRKPAY